MAGQIEWDEFNPGEYESQPGLPYLFEIIEHGQNDFRVNVFNKKSAEDYDPDGEESEYNEGALEDFMDCTSLERAKEAAEYYLENGSFDRPLPRTEAPTPDQFESLDKAVDSLLESTPRGLQRAGKQAFRDPRRCRKPNGH